MEGQPVPTSLFSFHHLFRPSSRRVYPLPFFRLIQMSARRSRINATRYARNHSNDPWIFIARPPTTLFVLFPTPSRTYACACVCVASPQCVLTYNYATHWGNVCHPLMLTFVNRVGLLCAMDTCLARILTWCRACERYNIPYNDIRIPNRDDEGGFFGGLREKCRI